LVLFGYTWVLFHHMLGGLRHFVWDSINGFEPGVREGLAWANVVVSVILTLLAWAIFVWF
jgi:succinate dehydrogenase / fumarate reductase cytochrome b subunit